MPHTFAFSLSLAVSGSQLHIDDTHSLSPSLASADCSADQGLGPSSAVQSRDSASHPAGLQATIVLVGVVGNPYELEGATPSLDDVIANVSYCILAHTHFLSCAPTVTHTEEGPSSSNPGPVSATPT